MRRGISAGIMLHRRSGQTGLMVFLCHPGGPFWDSRDDGAWSIPKGRPEPADIDLEAVARREFEEGVGLAVTATLEPLGAFRRSSGKITHVWHGSQDIDEQMVASNLIEMEWPPRSGQTVRFPEMDRGAWFTVADARVKLLEGQLPILDALVERLG